MVEIPIVTDPVKPKMYTHSSGYYICSYDGCLGRHYALGLCRMHWNRANIKKQQEEHGESLWRGLNEAQVKRYLEVALSELPEREHRVIQLRFMEDKTLFEVGCILSVTRERVRQIEASALRKIRAKIYKEKQDNG